jgi:hypothetical protein
MSACERQMGDSSYLCVWDVLEVSDVRVGIIETTNEGTSLRMDSQAGLVGLIVTSGPRQGHACSENGNGNTYKHFE